jgi:HK97 family phage major capsid protein
MDTTLQREFKRLADDIERREKKINELQVQIDAVDIRTQARHVGGGSADGAEALKHKLQNDDGFQRLCRDRKGSAILNLEGSDCRLIQHKTVLLESGVGVGTSGVMPIERLPGIVPEARQQLFLRSLLVSRPTTQLLVDFVRVTTPMGKASPQTEGEEKAQQAVSFESVSEKVKTLACWLPASKQILDDLQDLASFINSSLTYYLALAEELQFLSGDNSGENLHGLIPQAQPFDVSLLGSSWTLIDVLAAAVEQINRKKEIPPTFAVVSHSDWWKIRRTKDSLGRYLLGDPGLIGTPRLWNLDVLPTSNMAEGYFLVGSGLPAAAEIRDRQQAQIEVSTSHSDYFTRNLVAIRVEERLALITKRPDSFVYGSFSTSP